MSEFAITSFASNKCTKRETNKRSKKCETKLWHARARNHSSVGRQQYEVRKRKRKLVIHTIQSRRQIDFEDKICVTSQTPKEHLIHVVANLTPMNLVIVFEHYAFIAHISHHQRSAIVSRRRSSPQHNVFGSGSGYTGCYAI